MSEYALSGDSVAGPSFYHVLDDETGTILTFTEQNMKEMLYHAFLRVSERVRDNVIIEDSAEGIADGFLTTDQDIFFGNFDKFQGLIGDEDFVHKIAQFAKLGVFAAIGEETGRNDTRLEADFLDADEETRTLSLRIGKVSPYSDA